MNIFNIVYQIPSKQYNIFINHDYLTIIKKYAISWQIVIITDNLLLNLYVNDLKQLLLAHNFVVLVLILPRGESAKNIFYKTKLEKQMMEANIQAQALCIGFGGGSIGDIAGFIASTYMRGINLLHIPTTLLAMVDSSIGGKNAINTKYAKNLIGTFFNPQAIIINYCVLNSLPIKHFVNGMIEVIKIALTNDSLFFIYLESYLLNILKIHKRQYKLLTKSNIKNNIYINQLDYIINTAIALKKYIIEIDPLDNNIRKTLNFGHTIAHGLEKLFNYKILHGYAVLVGILIESQISTILNILSKQDFSRILQLTLSLDKYFPLTIINKIDIEQLLSIMLNDKKNYYHDSNTHKYAMILLKSIGVVAINDTLVTHDVTRDIIIQAIKQLQNTLNVLHFTDI